MSHEYEQHILIPSDFETEIIYWWCSLDYSCHLITSSNSGLTLSGSNYISLHLNHSQPFLQPVFPRALSWGPVCSSSVYFLLAIYFVTSTSHLHGYANNGSYLFSSCPLCPSMLSDPLRQFWTVFSIISEFFHFHLLLGVGVRVGLRVSCYHTVIISITLSFRANIAQSSYFHRPPPAVLLYMLALFPHIPFHLFSAALTLSAWEGTLKILLWPLSLPYV